MSAKWRRVRRDPKRFNIFKTIRKIKDRQILPTFQAKSLRSKGQSWSGSCGFPKAYFNRRTKEPEPLIDVLDERNETIIVAELAGFDSKNLRIRVKNQRLTLSAEARDRKYHKSLNLPKRVIPNTMRTTCKNGVLEIRLKKNPEEKTIDKVAG